MSHTITEKLQMEVNIFAMASKGFPSLFFAMELLFQMKPSPEVDERDRGKMEERGDFPDESRLRTQSPSYWIPHGSYTVSHEISSTPWNSCCLQSALNISVTKQSNCIANAHICKQME
jgi:hypothetical protein